MLGTTVIPNHLMVPPKGTVLSELTTVEVSADWHIRSEESEDANTPPLKAGPVAAAMDAAVEAGTIRGTGGGLRRPDARLVNTGPKLVSQIISDDR